jgi:hypothetical protein
MQANILALVFVDMDGDLLNQMNRLAANGFQALQISGENVVSLAGGNALGELSHVIGVELPTHFVRLIAAFANFHRNAVHGPVIGSPDGSGDQGVGLSSGFLCGEQAILRAEGWQEKQRGDSNYEQLPG